MKINELIKKLFSGGKDTGHVTEEKTADSAEAVPDSEAAKEPYLTETVVFGMHLYRRDGDDSSVYFVDERRAVRKMLVDSVGRIKNFPGIVKEDFWVKAVSKSAMEPQIRFRTSFEEREKGWIMLWQIQPDGRYWADDDGFGMENEPEVTLYTYVDMKGSFTGPFRIYELGSRCYSLDRHEHAHSRWYRENILKLKAGILHDGYFERPTDMLFPCLNYAMRDSGYRSFWDHYSLHDCDEARRYWAHPQLSAHLREAAEALLELPEGLKEAGYLQERCIHSCITLFCLATGDELFKEVLDKLFKGENEERTERYLFR